MSDAINTIVSSIVRILFIFLVVFTFGYISLYWAVWNNCKLTLGKAMAEIEDNIDKDGMIVKSKAEEALAEYCNINAIDSCELKEVFPGYDTPSAYIGQPMYVEAELTYSVLGREHKMRDRVSAHSRGHYGEGYNTHNDKKDY